MIFCLLTRLKRSSLLLARSISLLVMRLSSVLLLSEVSLGLPGDVLVFDPEDVPGLFAVELCLLPAPAGFFLTALSSARCLSDGRRLAEAVCVLSPVSLFSAGLCACGGLFFGTGWLFAEVVLLVPSPAVLPESLVLSLIPYAPVTICHYFRHAGRH